MLEGLIRTLNEHDIRVVVIKATDVRDKLMLARELRRGVRDVVLIVYESHVLLRRPEYAEALRGALVLSTYPMALENQFWTTAHRGTTSDSTYVRLRDLLAFPTDAAIGTYNAALSLLGLPQLRVEFDLHNAFAGDSTYHLPPVWLSVVGRDGFYPLRAEVPAVKWRSYLGPPTVAATTDTTVGERVHEHSYTHDDISLSIIIVVPALLIAGLLAMFLTGRDGLNRLGLVLPDSLERPASATESLYLALFVLSLSATYLPFSVAIDARRIVASVDAYSGGPSVAMWIVLGLFVLVVLIGVVLLVNGFHGLIWGTTATPTVERRAPVAADAGAHAGSVAGGRYLRTRRLAEPAYEAGRFLSPDASGGARHGERAVGGRAGGLRRVPAADHSARVEGGLPHGDRDDHPGERDLHHRLAGLHLAPAQLLVCRRDRGDAVDVPRVAPGEWRLAAPAAGAPRRRASRSGPGGSCNRRAPSTIRIISRAGCATSPTAAAPRRSGVARITPWSKRDAA